jgi:hypothetical protein
MKSKKNQILKSYTPKSNEKMILIKKNDKYNTFAIYKNWIYERQIKIENII